MKLKIFSLLVILGVMSVTPMIYMGKLDPSSILASVMNTDMPDFKKLDVKAPAALANIVPEEKVQVYKWRDEHGVMQFSNTPPVDGGISERVELNPNRNVVAAVRVPVKEEKEEVVAAAAVKPPSPYSIKGMKKVVDDAKGIEEMLQKRNEDQQKLMNNL